MKKVLSAISLTGTVKDVTETKHFRQMIRDLQFCSYTVREAGYRYYDKQVSWRGLSGNIRYFNLDFL